MPIWAAWPEPTLLVHQPNHNTHRVFFKQPAGSYLLLTECKWTNGLEKKESNTIKLIALGYQVSGGSKKPMALCPVDHCAARTNWSLNQRTKQQRWNHLTKPHLSASAQPGQFPTTDHWIMWIRVTPTPPSTTEKYLLWMVKWSLGLKIYSFLLV